MIKVRLLFPDTDYLNDVQDVPRAFSPYLVADKDAEHFLRWDTVYTEGKFCINIDSDLWEKRENETTVSQDDFLLYKKLTKRFLKNNLYEYLTEKLGICLPYGSLTGVRPTKLFDELLQAKEEPMKTLAQNFFVEQSRIKLISDCVTNQKAYKNTQKNSVALFLNIPFCPTRCSYCSFISTEVFRIKKELPLYVETVKRDTEAVFRLMDDKGYSVSSVYVGGGTPSSVGSKMLDEMLRPFSALNVEFTVEAGRPDAMGSDIVDCLKNNNVTRVSVNPQSFHDKTLTAIGRAHTAAEIEQAYQRVRRDFSVNMDLIAGLPGEDAEDFLYSVEQAIRLRPDNVTIHNLSLKRGSELIQTAEKQAFGMARQMTDAGYERLYASGYVPYYMYRQKNTADNLENVGFCLPDRQCKYNIDMMEESSTVLAIGAGGMTKRVEDGRINRFSNPKGFREYCSRIEDTLQKRNAIFNM